MSQWIIILMSVYLNLGLYIVHHIGNNWLPLIFLEEFFTYNGDEDCLIKNKKMYFHELGIKYN